MALQGVSEAMTAAWRTYQARQRFDRRNGTVTRHELPEDQLVLAREYKRLQMRVYRSQDSGCAVGDHLLKEDGIIDPVAVEIAAHGRRLVDLTRRERVLAVWLMERWGLTQREMERRLQLPDSAVYYLRQSAAKLSEADFYGLVQETTSDRER